MRDDDGVLGVVDSSVVGRVAALEDELSELYEALALHAPDREAAMLLERLASAARSRAQLFASGVEEAPEHDPVLRWIDAQSRFEQASAEAAESGDRDLLDLHREVVRVGRELDVLLLAAGGVLDG